MTGNQINKCLNLCLFGLFLVPLRQMLEHGFRGSTT